VSARIEPEMLQTFCFKLFPDSPNRMIVGTNHGKVVHGVRHGEQVAPRSFEVPSGTDIHSLDFNPYVSS
jgi:hypothetical protein